MEKRNGGKNKIKFDTSVLDIKIKFLHFSPDEKVIYFCYNFRRSTHQNVKEKQCYLNTKKILKN